MPGEKEPTTGKSVRSDYRTTSRKKKAKNLSIMYESGSRKSQPQASQSELLLADFHFFMIHRGNHDVSKTLDFCRDQSRAQKLYIYGFVWYHMKELAAEYIYALFIAVNAFNVRSYP